MTLKEKLLLLLVSVLLLTASASVAEQSAITRLDGDGYLYFMDYTRDYYSPQVIDAMRKAGIIDPGCSSFMTHNTDGEPISCRNYDFPHRMSSEDQTLTGLNVVLHCKPEGKYESIALADAIWCDPDDPFLRAGGPDREGFDISVLDIIPYECMDGINEKGLFVSIMRVDIRKGDQPARMAAGSSILLRYLLDDCADVEEAVKKIDTSIVTPEDWQDCHIFVTDAGGRCAVIESRNSDVSVIDSDVVTNFYLGYDDIEDYYKNGELKEDAVKMNDENGDGRYKYGFGHGYHRFVTIASQLERYQDKSAEAYRTVMPEATALVILQSAVQNEYTESTGTSMTQYSAIYNNARKTVRVWPFQNYETCYEFDVTGARLN